MTTLSICLTRIASESPRATHRETDHQPWHLCNRNIPLKSLLVLICQDFVHRPLLRQRTGTTYSLSQKSTLNKTRCFWRSQAQQATICLRRQPGRELYTQIIFCRILEAFNIRKLFQASVNTVLKCLYLLKIIDHPHKDLIKRYCNSVQYKNRNHKSKLRRSFSVKRDKTR